MQYPNKIKQTKNKVINYAKRGMTLEDDLNKTNKYYLENDIAIINKKPTPIKIVKVVFDCNKNATIKEAYFEKPSTTDYNGIYKGKYIDFEAKEIAGNKCFPFKNINQHQVRHIESVIRHGGIAFLIVRFNCINKTFLLRGETLLEHININERKSIPIEVFVEQGFEIKENYLPRIDYIKIVNEYYLGGKI